ncbi:UNVERIFIED_CONTAM: hypothetical protein Sradi_2522700 [Sesamum radiatum]|uniref:Uncharacterized protein n=1 Tax=Sesamum radiatum TaxID=300843 RepID=A0AAW2SKP2_SESRA
MEPAKQRISTPMLKGGVSLGWGSAWSRILRRMDMGGWDRLPPNLISIDVLVMQFPLGKGSLSSRALKMFLDVLGVLLLIGVWTAEGTYSCLPGGWIIRGGGLHGRLVWTAVMGIHWAMLLDWADG